MKETITLDSKLLKYVYTEDGKGIKGVYYDQGLDKAPIETVTMYTQYANTTSEQVVEMINDMLIKYLEEVK